MRWRRRSAKHALDELTNLGIIVEGAAIFRVGKLVRLVWERLRSLPVEDFSLRDDLYSAESAERMLKALNSGGGGPGPPGLVLAWHRRWGQLLMDVRQR
jgi:hypothetical protein